MINDVKNKAISNTFWKLAERVFAQGISLIVSIVIARILTPSDYSVVSLVTIFFSFANVIISGGLNTALIQKKDADHIDYSSVLFLSVLLSFVAYLILFLVAPSIARIYKQDQIVIVTRVMGLSLPITAIKSIWCAYVSSKLQFKKFFYATLGGTIVSGIVGIYMAYSGFGAWSLVAQQMINTTIDTIILILCTRIGIVLRFSVSRIKTLFNYGWKIFVSSFIGIIYSEISPLIIGVKYTKNDLSFYTKGKSFPMMLSSVSTNTLSAVLFPILAKYQDDKEAVLKYTRLFMRLSSFLSFPILLGLFSVADTFVAAVLTSKWNNSVYYIRIFCICSMFDIVALGNCETIKAIGRSDVYLIMEIIKKSLYFVIIFVFTKYSSSPEVLSISSLVCVMVQILVNSIPNIKLINYSIRDQITDLLPSLFCASIMCLVVIIVGKNISCNIWMKLVAEMVCGVAVYVPISFLINRKTMTYAYNTLKGFIRK